MKTVELKKIFFQTKIFPIMIFIIISSVPVISASEKFNFSLSPEIGLLNGHIYEYVFEDVCTNTNHLESKLDWEVQNIPFVEISTNFDFFKYINLCVNGKIGIPKTSGYMKDYDWLNYLYWPDDNPTELTNYSISTNKLNTFYSLNASLGINFFINKNNKITIFAAYDYFYIGFDAYDGYYSYKNYNWKKISLSGKVISYFQEYNSFLVGIKTNHKISKWNLDFLLSFSPNLCTNNALDFHYLTSTLYWDNIKNIFQLNTKFSSSFKIGKHSKIGASFACKYIPLSKGNNYSTDISSEGEIIGKNWDKPEPEVFGGTSNFLYSFSIFYNIGF